jgi:hypothetical protein
MWRRALRIIAGVSALVAVGGYWYATALQPDPTIKTLPMTWQNKKTAGPVFNTGVDAAGMTLDQWKNAGRNDLSYKPVPILEARAGTKVMLLRANIYAHKLAEPLISRQWLCGRISDGPNGPIVDSSGVVPYPLPPMRPPVLSHGPSVKQHIVEIPPEIGRDVTGAPLTGPRRCLYEVSARFHKNAVSDPVDVKFAGAVLTILPADPAAPDAAATGARR